MFARYSFFKPLGVLLTGGLLACSAGGSAQSNFPAKAPPGSTVLAQDPSTSTTSSTRADAGVVTPALTTIDTCNLSSPCISGTNSGVGAGIAGISTNGRGVNGITKHNSTSPSNAMYGLYGQDLSTSGVYNGGVFGSSVRGNGVWAQSSSNFGLRAISSSGTATYSTSSTGYGMYGTSIAGIGTVGISSQYIGLYGSGPGDGVYGFSSTNSGVFGSTSGGTAVYASSGTGFGVQAHTSGHVGAYVTNGNGNGADITGSYIGTVTRGPANGFPLVVTDSSGNNLMWVTGTGDLHYVGSLVNGVRLGGGFMATSFSPTASRPSIEDTGTAHLVYGKAIVRLDPTFARAIDRRRPYQVFITPGGDTRGLYVAAKGASSFVVREVQGGRSSFDFDYHIYATQLGASAVHMSIVAPSAPVLHPEAPAIVKPPTVPQSPG